MRQFLVLMAMVPALARGEELLHAGPMHAWTELRSAAIWVQTERAADVQLRYFPAATPAASHLTPVITTAAAQQLTASFVLSGLEPGAEYRYELYIDGRLVERPYPLSFTTQPLWQWRTAPPDFAAMFGSCLYVNEARYDRPGTPYGSAYQILAAMATYADTTELLAWIERNRIEGVLFLSGDRHHGELIRVQRPGVYPLYDFTGSSITAGVHVMKPDDPELRNPLRVDGTLVMEHNFGILSFAGDAKHRRVALQLCGVDGAVRWERAINREELSFPSARPQADHHKPTT